MNKLYPLYMAVIFLMMSCSKEENNNTEAGMATVTINVSGAEYQSGAPAKAPQASAFAAPSSLSTAVQQRSIALGNGLSVDMQLRPQTAAATADLQANATPRTTSGSSVIRTNLPEGTPYTVAVYTRQGVFVESKNLNYSATAAAPSLSLAPGQYTFVVLSAGNGQLPAINFQTPLDQLSLAINNADVDMMTFTQEVQVKGAGMNTLNVTFKHRFTQVKVVVDATAVGSIASVGALTVAPNFSRADVNLFTGALTIPTQAQSATRSLSFTSAQGTVLTTAPSYLLVKNTDLGEVVIKDVKIGAVTRTLTLKNLHLEEGVSYELRLTLKSSSNSKKAIDIGGAVLWAPGNLVLNNGVYGFTASQELSGDHWKANSLTIYPAAGQADYAADRDPCRLVNELGGNWRLPTVAEFDAVLGNRSQDFNAKNYHIKYGATTERAYYGAQRQEGLFLGVNSQPVPEKESTYVFLPYAQEKDAFGKKDFTNEFKGTYWTASRAGKSNNVHRFQFNKGNVSLPISGQSQYYEYGGSIRCVKNK